MSIRTNPMKAVPVLLKRVKSTRSEFLKTGRNKSLDGQLVELTGVLNKIQDVFMRVKKNQDELLDALHEVDSHLRKLDRNRLDQDTDYLDKDMARIRACARKLLPMDTFESDSCAQKSGEIVESSSHGPSSTQPQHINQTPNMQQLIRNQLGWVFSLSLFPQDAVFNRRQTIYWWIGRGFVFKDGEKTAEEVGEEVIDQLLSLNMIIPYGNGKCSLFNKFIINPHIRSQLENHVVKGKQPHLGHYVQLSNRLEYHQDHIDCLVLKQRKAMLGDGDGLKPGNSISVVCNVGTSYLNFGSQWMDELKDLEVLQLGRWQDSPTHHIEVESQEFLKDLSHLKELRYLSLRGISRISELPPSIAEHESLEILDLKACHNLETLPNDISSMKSLTHLILSQCYLLDGMPKGIEKLAQLQVLKGYVIGNSRKTPCRISDLANLKELRRLSIHIGNEAFIKDLKSLEDVKSLEDFKSLGELPALEHLKISWGVSDTRYGDIQITLPKSLKKLHIQGFPGQRIPEWLKPSNLSGSFKELKITGGKLESMDHDGDTKWLLEIVRLKHLKLLNVDKTNLRELFPSLRGELNEEAVNEMKNRGKEKISDSKCSWTILTESSDRGTDRTFSCSHDYSGPS